MKVLFYVLGIALIATLGCQNQGDVVHNQDSDDSNPESKKAPETKVVSSTKSPIAESPAKAIVPEAEADEIQPADVCEAFVKALVKNDSIVAGQNLTRQALFETRRAELELGPPGSEKAEYKIGKTFYATSKKKVAQVECFVAEPDSSVPSKLLWILKRENTGWKIAGMMAYGEDVTPDLVSFENRVDINRIKEALESPSSEIQQNDSNGLQQAALEDPGKEFK